MDDSLLITISSGVVVGIVVLFIEYTYFQRQVRGKQEQMVDQYQLPHKGRARVHSSRIVITFRDLEDCWKELDRLRTYDEWSGSPKPEDLEQLNTHIRKARKLIEILARDLQDWFELVGSNSPWGLWSLKELGQWRTKICREMLKRGYLDQNKEQDMELLDRVYGLLSQCWLQVLLLIDHLELPREYKANLKLLWANRVVAFAFGVLSSLAAAQF